jgi:hypothetical protein
VGWSGTDDPFNYVATHQLRAPLLAGILVNALT